MPSQRFSSLPEQVADSIRERIRSGRWSGKMPGRDRLVRELGVSGKTVESALRQLQREGVLESQGPGRRRRIVATGELPTSSLRIAILTFEPLVFTEGYMVEIQHLLNKAGHSAFFTEKSLEELGYEVKKIARFVKETAADAWLVISAPRDVLEWFIKMEITTFALFGRRRGLPIPGAGPDKGEAMVAIARRLVELGHRRIVLLTRKARRLPIPGTVETLFIEELSNQGVMTSAYNLPDWEETVEGFHERLDTLFRITPPTALVVDEVPFFLAAQQFCASTRLRVPEDISLISTDDDPHFAWFTPTVSQIRWDRRPVMRRIERWAGNVSRGNEDRRQTFSKAKFIEGGTIGPVKR